MLELFMDKSVLENIESKEVSALESSILKKCDAMLRHKTLLEVIAAQVKTPSSDKDASSAASQKNDESVLNHISAGLLNVLNGSDHEARAKLLQSLISSIRIEESKHIVEFKIPGQENLVLSEGSSN